jgi:ABC-2 type transport system permease protein
VKAPSELRSEVTTAEQPRSPAPPPIRNGRWSGFFNLLVARAKEMQREPEVIFWVFVFPLLLASGLGIAFRNKPADVTRVIVIAGQGADHVAQLLKAAPGHSSFRVQILPEDQARKSFRLGKSDLVISQDPSGELHYQYDPVRQESVLAKTEVDDALQSCAGRENPLPTEARASSEPGSRYIDFLIPGLLGMNLMNSGMWGLGFALVDMRQRKLIKRFIATPMRRMDFLLALASSRLLLMLAELILLLGFGIFFFHMRVLGSWASIVLISAVGAMTFGGLGLLTGSRARKIESVSGLINLVMMPMWIFSGVFFSYERFPALVQPFIKALPLTALNDSLRATILEGSSLVSQGKPLLVMLLWGGISFILALRWFRWS